MIPRIAVFHPGIQHSHQTALAFQPSGRLAWYATSIIHDPNRWPYIVLPFVPSGLRRQLERELRRRYHPELDPGMLCTLGYWECGSNGSACGWDSAGWSTTPTSGGTRAEALASGLPVVTTPNSGSIVRDRIEDCVVSIRDVDSLVSSVEFLHQERHARVAMGRRAQQRALKFRRSRYTGGMVQLSEYLMAERVA